MNSKIVPTIWNGIVYYQIEGKGYMYKSDSLAQRALISKSR